MSKLNDIKFRIKAAALSVNRDPESINLIAVSKRQKVSKIVELINEGHLNFGENQIQEITEKWQEVSNYRDKINLNFIGSIQSKKTEEILKFCDTIHSIDREKIVKQISTSRYKDKKFFFVQVNIGSEKQKSGVNSQDIDSFLNMCNINYNIPIKGLMCIPPNNDDPVPYFLKMREIAERNNIKNLSMGMSNDFEKAIQCGATHIRLGTILFGERINR